MSQCQDRKGHCGSRKSHRGDREPRSGGYDVHFKYIDSYCADRASRDQDKVSHCGDRGSWRGGYDAHTKYVDLDRAKYVKSRSCVWHIRSAQCDGCVLAEHRCGDCGAGAHERTCTI